MQIAISDEDIDEFIGIINQIAQEHPILVDKYIMGKEIEVDAICDGTDILIPGIMQHIERTAAAQAIMTSTGISLPIVDGGWSTMATISWAWPYAFLMFPLLIAVNVVMILLNKTNTINADLWNVWLKIFTAVAVVSITHSVILAFVIAAVQIILELKSSDAHQHRIEKLTGIPGWW